MSSCCSTLPPTASIRYYFPCHTHCCFYLLSFTSILELKHDKKLFLMFSGDAEDVITQGAGAGAGDILLFIDHRRIFIDLLVLINSD